MKGFNSLDLYYKSDLLKQQANFLVTLEMTAFSVELYTWDRFFIEQYFDEMHQVSRISIAGKDDLIKYLDAIDLSDIGYPRDNNGRVAGE